MSELGERRTAVVIEDDEDIRELLVTVLGQGGFEVHATGTGTADVALVREHAPSVTTLDVSLPDIDGFEVARRVRTFSPTYIVMLTARAEEIDTLMGLEAGADDYITKPFRPRELRARISAMLRRPRLVTGAEGPADVAGPTRAAVRMLAHNGLQMDVDARLVDLDGMPVRLTRSEFELLAALLCEPHRVLTKAELVRALWNEEFSTGADVSDADKRSVEVHVANLRRKLGEDATRPRLIETVRGVGYRLTPSC
ncbi:response regulator transcription factor [Georgenia sp. AZ-5]|uniref:response regulator transcription factor n=1 Tax=Georgenia sp. AZ-5 TaxID=3367526 RepID=UPI003754DDE4